MSIDSVYTVPIEPNLNCSNQKPRIPAVRGFLLRPGGGAAYLAEGFAQRVQLLDELHNVGRQHAARLRFAQQFGQGKDGLVAEGFQAVGRLFGQQFEQGQEVEAPVRVQQFEEFVVFRGWDCVCHGGVRVRVEWMTDGSNCVKMCKN